MKTTKVQVSDLLEVLEDNRTIHRTTYEQAMAAWKKQATKALKKAAKKAEEKGKITQAPLLGLPKPQHFLDSYDTVIQRLQMEVGDTVELDEQEFKAWVMNEWSWQGMFAANTSLYNG